MLRRPASGPGTVFRTISETVSNTYRPRFRQTKTFLKQSFRNGPKQKKAWNHCHSSQPGSSKTSQQISTMRPDGRKLTLSGIGPHCALPVAEFARFGCGKTATRPSDESFYKDSIIGLSFLKFDKIIPCPKKDVSSATYTKNRLW